jgi:hypothetical protein
VPEFYFLHLIGLEVCLSFQKAVYVAFGLYALAYVSYGLAYQFGKTKYLFI